jgi:hypothetical protein
MEPLRGQWLSYSKTQWEVCVPPLLRLSVMPSVLAMSIGLIPCALNSRTLAAPMPVSRPVVDARGLCFGDTLKLAFSAQICLQIPRKHVEGNYSSPCGSVTRLQYVEIVEAG